LKSNAKHRHGIDDGGNDGEGGGGGRATDAMLRRDRRGEAVAECGGRDGRRRVAAGAGARQGQGVAGRSRQRQLQV